MKLVSVPEPYPSMPSLNGQPPVAEYLYTDEERNVLFGVARYEPKDFRQYAWLGDLDRWDSKLGDARRVLYRLPEILNHLDDRNGIFIVEGERDVEAIERAGGVATCNPMGAGKWNDSYSESLTGARHVVIVADKDGPGLKHAIEVRESLGRVGVVPDIKQAREGKDATDHLAADTGSATSCPSTTTWC